MDRNPGECPSFVLCRPGGSRAHGAGSGEQAAWGPGSLSGGHVLVSIRTCDNSVSGNSPERTHWTYVWRRDRGVHHGITFNDLSLKTLGCSERRRWLGQLRFPHRQGQGALWARTCSGLLV